MGIFRVKVGKMELPKTTSTHVRNSEKKNPSAPSGARKFGGLKGDFDCPRKSLRILTVMGVVGWSSPDISTEVYLGPFVSVLDCT